MKHKLAKRLRKCEFISSPPLSGMGIQEPKGRKLFSTIPGLDSDINTSPKKRAKDNVSGAEL